jgi:tyrosine-specific transport protein
MEWNNVSWHGTLLVLVLCSIDLSHGYCNRNNAVAVDRNSMSRCRYHRHDDRWPAPVTILGTQPLSRRQSATLCSMSRRSKTSNNSNSNSNNNDKEEDTSTIIPKTTRVEENESTPMGSVVGASCLFAGTAIGAGMLALPAETAPAGFVPSIVTLVGCWVFTIVTSLITLEATWLAQQEQQFVNEDNLGTTDAAATAPAPVPVGFVSITKLALGPMGEVITALLFWFLLSSIVVAYTSEGGQLLSAALQEIRWGSSSTPSLLLLITPNVASTLFLTFFALLGIFGTRTLDLVNRVLVVGLIASFVGLVGVSLPAMQPDTLVSRADWTFVYPQVLSIGILSFGAQNIIPTLLQYLGGCPKRTTQAIWVGTLIPLVMYTLWELVFLGIVPYEVGPASTNDENYDAASKMQIVSALGAAGGVMVKDLVNVFSACAIGSSMAGASVSLVDFFQDALAVLASFTSEKQSPQMQQRNSEDSSTSNKHNNNNSRRIQAAVLALSPPLGLAIVFPDAFLGSLENAGLIGGVSLYGVLPALAVVNLRRRRRCRQPQDKSRGPPWLEANAGPMPGQVMGGDVLLYFVVIVSTVVILPDVVRLVGNGLLSWS